MPRALRSAKALAFTLLQDAGIARRLRLDWPGMTEAKVLDILDAIQSSGHTAYVMGGWGVDALLGRQTRVHKDLDLVCSTDAPVLSSLEPLGFRLVEAASAPGALFPDRLVLRDASNLEVDLHPVTVVDVDEPGPGRAARQEAILARSSIVPGVIGGRDVLCLAADLQIAGRSGYRSRWADVRDLRLLRRWQQSSQRL